MKIIWLTAFLILHSQAEDESEGYLSNSVVTKAKNYLKRYGYLDNLENINVTILMKAIQEFQKFADLKQTGELDIQTLSMMNSARYCQEIDTLRQTVTKGPQNTLTTIKYSIRNRGTISLNEAEIEKQVRRATELWANQSNIEFIPDYCSTRQIEIRIGVSEVTIEDNVLADIRIYADKMGIPIYIDINDNIHWTKDNFYATVVHQLGHALGLGHIRVKSSVMFPYVNYLTPERLNKHDIKSIQAIYGKKGDSTDTKLICDDPKFDAVFTVPNKTIYIFKGDNYWEYDGKRVVKGPHKFCERWGGLPCLKMDGALSYTNNKTYFFRNDHVWVFDENQTTAEPQLMSQVFSGIPSQIDGVSTWSRDETIYFFKGNKYWGFDLYQDEKLESGWPLNIADEWNGLPNTNFESVVNIGAFTYFFKAPNYYEYDDDTIIVSSGYPKKIVDWLDC